MGEEYTYRCRQCGHDEDLIAGMYNCKGWGDRKDLAEIREGKYGKDARDTIERHPKAMFHFQADVFRCTCGYTKSYDSLVIHADAKWDPEVFFMTRHRCPRCNKSMELVDHFPTDVMCPKCGGDMWIDTRSLCRW